MRLPCDDETADAIGASWLLLELTPAGPHGRRALERVQPFRPGQERQARARAERIARLADACESSALDSAAVTQATAPDVAPVLGRARLGETLGDHDFLQLLRFGDAVAAVDRIVAALEPPIANEALESVRSALESSRSGERGFGLGGEGGEAGRARADLAAAQAAFDQRRQATLADAAVALRRSEVSDDEFVVMRSEMPAALPAGLIVLRQSATYLLCRIEYGPQERELLERRDAAARRLASVEESVRAELSAAVREAAAGIAAAATALGEAELLIVAAIFAKRYECRPADLTTRPGLVLSGAHFPPIERPLAEEGRTFVPLDLKLEGAAVLTGPNMGGKSVCLRTCGFVALCAALGLPVPAQRAQTALFDDVAWMGNPAGDADRGGLLSSFAREVVRARDVLSRPGRRLVLVDEFARTTAPHEGAALLAALLARLQSDGTIALAATHLSGIAAAAGVPHFAVRGLRGTADLRPEADLHSALATLAANMDYSIEAVDARDAGRSDALALAQLLGLDGDLIADARRRAAVATE